MIAAILLWSAPAAADPLDRWSAEILEASSRFHIPGAWIRTVMRIESGGRTTIGGRPVVSSTGAMGLMQLMPGTWRDMRELLGLGNDPFDPRDNILAGTLYLRLMYHRFGYPALFAAYNAGPARYAAALRSTVRLPAETRAYVARAAGEATPFARQAAGHRLFAIAPGKTPPPPAGSSQPRRGKLFVQLTTPLSGSGPAIESGGVGRRPSEAVPERDDE